MEERFQMRFLLTVFSFSLALLTGCANLPEQQPQGGSLSPIAKGSVKREGIATLSLPNDLWERIRKGYQMPDLESDLVNDRTQWYASKPEYLQRMGERSSKYLFHIVEEIEKRIKINTF